MTLPPVRHQQREAVQQQLPEAGVVLGQVADVRFGEDGRRAVGRWRAVEVGRAVDAEMEGRGLVARIDLLDPHQAQRIGGEIPAAIQRDQKMVVLVGIGVGHRLDIRDGDAGDADAAFQREETREVGTRFGQFGRQLAQEIRAQRRFIRAEFDEIEPIPSRAATHQPAAVVLLAAQCHAGSSGQIARVKRAVSSWPVWRRT